MKQRITLIVFGVVLLVVLLAGCNLAPGTMPAVSGTPTPTYDGTQVLLVHAQATATQNAVAQTAVALWADTISAERTADYYHAQLTATYVEQTRQAEIYEAQQTAQAAQVTAQAEQTAQWRAWEVQGWTATAEADMATAEAQQTATADGMAVVQTQQAMQYTATADTSSAQMTATVAAAVAQSLDRANRRAELVNNALAVSPYVLGVLLALVSLWAIVAIMRVAVLRMRVIERDARGDVGIIVTPWGDYYDPDRNPGAVMRTGRAGASAPQLGEPEDQRQVTQRDQMIDLAHRGLPAIGGTSPQQRAAVKQAQQLMPVQPRPIYRIYQPADVPPAIPQDVAEALDADWREVDDENS